MQLPMDLDILAAPSRPTRRGMRLTMASGSGKTLPYSSLNRRATNRVISMWGSWSSPTGTRSALQKRMSAAWLTG